MNKRGPGRPRPDYDFDLARSDYLRDPALSLNRIADEYGIPRATLARRARQEGWKEMRAASEGGKLPAPPPPVLLIADEEAFFEDEVWW